MPKTNVYDMSGKQVGGSNSPKLCSALSPTSLLSTMW